MSEAKFTKGPWGISEDSWAKGSVDINSGDGSWYSLATVVTELDDSICQLNEEGRANANLIAAAPELYAVLDAIRIGAENYIDRKGGSVAYLDQIKDVLSKARGK